MTDLIRYSIPFHQPFEGAGFKMTHRDGLLIRFIKDGVIAWGEVSPLPGFSETTLDSCLLRIRSINGHLSEVILDPDDNQWLLWLRKVVTEPELRFGLDTLRTDFMSRVLGLPFHTYLNRNAPDAAHVNAVIGLLSPDETLKRGLELLDSGFRTLKIKIHDPRPYKSVFMELKQHQIKPQLRFDANGSWTIENSFDWAIALSAVEPEYLEQPFPQGRETDHAELQAKISFPLALDESVASEDAAIEAIENGITRVLILKPALIGDFQSLKNILQKARDFKVQCTLTTLLDSGVARRSVASLTVAYADSHKAHGLSTGSLLSTDPLHDITAEPGLFQLDTVAGLGDPILDDTFSWEYL